MQEMQEILHDFLAKNHVFGIIKMFTIFRKYIRKIRRERGK